jgi:hypothetical protein
MRQQYIAIHHFSQFPRRTRSAYQALSALPRHVSRARAAAGEHMQRLASQFGNMIL